MKTGLFAAPGKVRGRMRSTRNFASWAFRASAAVTAAVVADPVVERMSNAGVFGPGRFTDQSNIDVIPALCIASALSLLFVVLLARHMLTRSTYPLEWLRRCAAEVHSRPLWRMLPSIFVMQMSALFAMETLEQIAIAGHPFGGTMWLGGPIAFSLVFHLISCLLFAWTLSRALDWSARSVVRVVRFALTLLRKRFAFGVPPLLDVCYSARRKFIEPYLRALQGRAPPFLSVGNQ
jgi:hypothetical protein